MQYRISSVPHNHFSYSHNHAFVDFGANIKLVHKVVTRFQDWDFNFLQTYQLLLTLRYLQSELGEGVIESLSHGTVSHNA